MTTFKLCAAALAALTVLLMAAIVTLRVMLPAKLGGMILEQARTQLHREAQFDRIHLWIDGLTIERLRLSEQPDFSRGTFLFVESVRIRWAWRPLWRHQQLHLKEIVLDRPQLNPARQAMTFPVDDRPLSLTAQGVIELATGRLEADVRLRSAPRSALGDMDIKARLSGTWKNPKVRLSSLKKKNFKATIQNPWQAPNIFH